MSKKPGKSINLLLIGGIVAMIVLAIVLAIVVWQMQIRLDVPADIVVGETGMHTVQLGWETVENATSYGVYVYEEGQEAPAFSEQITATEIGLEGLYADHSYEISVVAFYDKKDKHIESEPSERVTVRTVEPKLESVEELRAEGNDLNSIALQWASYETTDTNADGTDVDILYTVLYSSIEDGTYEILAEDLEKTEYLHEGIEELDTYYYKVVVQEEMDEKSYLGQKDMTPVSATAAIGAVTGLTAEGVSESEIVISWDAYQTEKANADGTPVTFWYTVYAAESETAEYTVLADKIAENEYQEENLAPETTRYYKVSVTAQKDGIDITGEESAPVNAVTQEKKVVPNKTDTASNSGSASGSEAASGGGTSADSSSANASKDAQARAVAQQIANSITGGSDLEKVRQAAAIVAGYCNNATYTTSDPDYRTAYGLFCKGVYTCAGSTRALGMVLECMGYSWAHVNENQWSHQWCRVTMDGQVGWADGMGGIADYGECPFASGGTYTASDGTVYFVP